MDASKLLQWVRAALEDLRAEYEAHGLGEVFDREVERIRAEGRWPFAD
jgi:hypothetical protein